MQIEKQTAMPSIEHDFKRGLPEYIEELPAMLSCEGHIPTITEQERGSCLGHGGALAANIYRNSVGRTDWVDPVQLYKKIKKIDGIDKEGSQPKYLMEVMLREGLIEDCYDLKGKDGYVKVETVKQALAQGMIVGVGTLVSRGNWKDGDEWIVTPKGEILGLHWTTIVGFDDLLKMLGYKGYVRGANSWGSEWGEDGLFNAAYDYFSWRAKTDMPAVFEAWAYKFPEPVEPTAVDDANRDEKDIKIITADVAPFIEQGRMVAAVRFLARAFGAEEIEWNPETKTATFVRAEFSVIMQKGNPDVKIVPRARG